jgi:hypothetical protein
MKIKSCNKLEIIQNVENVQSVENEYERFKWAAYSTKNVSTNDVAFYEINSSEY